MVSRVTRVSPVTKDPLVAEVPLERSESAATMDVPARRAHEDDRARARARGHRVCRVFWDLRASRASLDTVELLVLLESQDSPD